MAKKDRRVKRKKAKKRVRGTPAFDKPLVGVVKPVECIAPETGMDIARLFADEVTKKWPDAKTQLPVNLSGKHVKLTGALAEEFTGEQIKSMMRVLVWDFEEVKKSKAFFPPCAVDMKWPWIDQLYNYRFALASATSTGITDSSSRSSAYAQRYLTGETPPATPKPVATSAGETPAKESLKDIARRLLGQ